MGSWVNAAGALSRPVPSSAEIKNEWSCISAPPVYFHGMDRNNITYLLTYLLTP